VGAHKNRGQAELIRISSNLQVILGSGKKGGDEEYSNMGYLLRKPSFQGCVIIYVSSEFIETLYIKV